MIGWQPVEAFKAESNGPKRGRTADLYTASVALYQLSYRPIYAGENNSKTAECQSTSP